MYHIPIRDSQDILEQELNRSPIREESLLILKRLKLNSMLRFIEIEFSVIM